MGDELLAVSQRFQPSSDAALDMLRFSGKKAISADALQKYSTDDVDHQASHPHSEGAPPLERTCSSGSTPIYIPTRQACIHASSARDRPDSDSTRVLRRVPEPPIRPAAVTAPAVVQLLLAAQAAAAADRLRQELAYHCNHNNLKLAYALQEKRRVLEARAHRLQSEGTPSCEQLPNPTSPPTNHRTQRQDVLKNKVEWEGWYDLPHGNIAAAEYCAGEAEKRAP
eukprot:jgi/Tetstr1/429469/TSEL_019377.t1